MDGAPKRVRFWQLWIVVIFVASGPWFGVTSTPQWDRLTWVPFTGAEDKLRDTIVNVALFLPLGWTLAARRAAPRGLLVAIGAGLATSFLAESMQLFCVLRDPSATDVLNNTIGSALGAAGAVAWSRRPLP